MVDMTGLLLLAPPLDRGHTAGRFDAEGQRTLADRCYLVISAARDGVTNETDGSFSFAGRKTVRTRRRLNDRRLQQRHRHHQQG
jgi:hypothetical protein